MSSGLRAGWMVILATLVLALGCSEVSDSVSRDTADLAGVTVEIAQSPTCECCGNWADYLQDRDATVEVTHVDDLAKVKAAAGIPDDLTSCHTATVEGYAVEGHVPAEALADLLDNAPSIGGLAVPGMPAGSPGMPGTADGSLDPLDVFAFTDDAVDLYGRY